MQMIPPDSAISRRQRDASILKVPFLPFATRGSKPLPDPLPSNAVHEPHSLAIRNTYCSYPEPYRCEILHPLTRGL